MINPDGNIQVCGSANVFCEKKLVRDSILCLDKSNLTGILSYNQSMTLSIASRMTATFCIEYCRGLAAGSQDPEALNRTSAP